MIIRFDIGALYHALQHAPEIPEGSTIQHVTIEGDRVEVHFEPPPREVDPWPDRSPTCACPVEPHPCPFEEEINNDSTPCTCCPECEHECSWDLNSPVDQ
jgi:hypothetical protein